LIPVSGLFTLELSSNTSTNIITVIYYAAIIFQSLGLTSNTTSLLASGVIGIINVATTIPAIYVIDRVGRKPLMMTGSAGMAICETIIGVIVATCGHDWAKHAAAGWAAVGRSLRLLKEIFLTIFSLRMDLHHKLRVLLGTRLMDSHCRNLPHLHPRQRDIHRRLCKLDEQFHYRFCRSSHA
jgi:MFS family permease